MNCYFLLLLKILFFNLNENAHIAFPLPQNISFTLPFYVHDNVKSLSVIFNSNQFNSLEEWEISERFLFRSTPWMKQPNSRIVFMDFDFNELIQCSKHISVRIRTWNGLQNDFLVFDIHKSNIWVHIHLTSLNKIR